MGFSTRLFIVLLAIHVYFRFKRSKSKQRFLDPFPYLLRIKQNLLNPAAPKLKPPSTGGLILVTGGSGFLGSYICRRLVEKGFKVRAADLGPPHKNRRVEGVEYFRLNLVTCSESQLAEALKGCCGVVHTAGIVALYNVPELLHNIHVYGTAKLMALASESPNVRAVVQTSSTCVVHNGAKSVIGMKPNAPYSARHLSGYARTKHQSEVIMLLSNGIKGVLTTSLRLPGVMGYGDGMVVTKMLDEGLSTFPSKETTVIEMLYVKNAAEAHACSIKTLLDEVKDENLRNSPCRANGSTFFVTNSDQHPEQRSILEFWEEGRSRLEIKDPMTFIPLPIAWTLAYTTEFIYWYFQGYVPATRSSIWNFTPKSLLYMVNDNSFGGQKEVEEGIDYKPLFTTNEMFDDILTEYKIAKGIE